MGKFLPRVVFFFSLILFFILLFFLPKPVLAKTYCDPYFACFDCTGSLCTGCSSDITFSDLTPCQEQLGPYQNTCCTQSGGCSTADGSWINLWDWSYASGCEAKFTQPGTCQLQYTYQTQTCGARDSCFGSPYLYAGKCGGGGCEAGGLYKTCCYSNGTVDGNCQGGQFSGTCPGGSTTVMCGVSQSTCSAIFPYPCTSSPCGGSACLAWFPQAAPTPTPIPPPQATPTSPPGCPAITCRYSEANPSCPDTGLQWVTGTGCSGDNCVGCTYVGGCSQISCVDLGEPTPTPGGVPPPTPTPTSPPPSEATTILNIDLKVANCANSYGINLTSSWQNSITAKGGESACFQVTTTNNGDPITNWWPTHRVPFVWTPVGGYGNIVNNTDNSQAVYLKYLCFNDGCWGYKNEPGSTCYFNNPGDASPTCRDYGGPRFDWTVGIDGEFCAGCIVPQAFRTVLTSTAQSFTAQAFVDKISWYDLGGATRCVRDGGKLPLWDGMKPNDSWTEMPCYFIVFSNTVTVNIPSPPTCNSLTVSPNPIAKGTRAKVSVSAQDEWDLKKIDLYYSPTGYAEPLWTKIGEIPCPGVSKSCADSIWWDTTLVNPGEYYVVGNVEDEPGGAGGLCSGNPWGVPAGWVECPNCRQRVTVNAVVPTPTPTKKLTPTPTPTVTPLPTITLPPCPGGFFDCERCSDGLCGQRAIFQSCSPTCDKPYYNLTYVAKAGCNAIPPCSAATPTPTSTPRVTATPTPTPGICPDGSSPSYPCVRCSDNFCGQEGSWQSCSWDCSTIDTAITYGVNFFCDSVPPCPTPTPSPTPRLSPTPTPTPTPTLGSLSGFVFLDDGQGGGEAGNGRKEGGEGYFEGAVKICLDSQFNCNDLIGVKNREIRYQFDNVPRGPHDIFIFPSDPYSASGWFGTDFEGGSIGVKGSNRATVYCCSSAEVNFGLWEQKRGWFQTQGGDVGSQKDLISAIPNLAVDKNFSISFEGFPGVVSYGEKGSAEFGQGAVSQKGWLAASSWQGKFPYDYNYFYDKAEKPQSPVFDGSLPPGDGVYFAPGSVTINDPLDFGSKKVTIFVAGDLEINKSVTVANEGFLAFIVRDHIKVKGTLGEKSNPYLRPPDLRGVFLAGKTLDTNSDGDSSGKNLVGEGVFVVWEGFTFARDLKEDNQKWPAELFRYDLNLLMNAPRFLKRTYMEWLEVPP